MSRNPIIFSNIAPLRDRYFKALHGKESLISTINAAEIPEHVYNSNAIENSTLSLEDTEKILLDIDLERFVTAREIHEAKNLARVTEYVEQKASQGMLTKELILLFHKMLIGNIDDSIAGRFRCNDEWVRIGSYIAADPNKIESLIFQVLQTHQINNTTNIISRIAQFHLDFEHVHPFCDGNGRIGRVLNNYLLVRDGYVPINISFADRARYYDAFKAFDSTKNIRIMEEIVGRALAESYHKRLAYMEGKKIVSIKEYAKSVGESHSNSLNKAERQTIEAFHEKGVWKIGVPQI
jgi:Fic family protein